MKIALVWGLGFGVVGLALGTSFGAWVNFAVLAFLARRRKVLVATPELKRAILPVGAASAAAAIGFFAGARLGHALIGPDAAYYDATTFAIAALCGAGGDGLSLLAFRAGPPVCWRHSLSRPSCPCQYPEQTAH